MLCEIAFEHQRLVWFSTKFFHSSIIILVVEVLEHFQDPHFSPLLCCELNVNHLQLCHKSFYHVNSYCCAEMVHQAVVNMKHGVNSPHKTEILFNTFFINKFVCLLFPPILPWMSKYDTSVYFPFINFMVNMKSLHLSHYLLLIHYCLFESVLVSVIFYTAFWESWISKKAVFHLHFSISIFRKQRKSKIVTHCDAGLDNNSNTWIRAGMKQHPTVGLSGWAECKEIM